MTNIAVLAPDTFKALQALGTSVKDSSLPGRMRAGRPGRAGLRDQRVEPPERQHAPGRGAVGV